MKTLHRLLLQGAASLCVVASATCMFIHADDPPGQPAAPVAQDDGALDLRKAAISVTLEPPTAMGEDGNSFMVGHTLKEAWVAKVASGNPRAPAAAMGVAVVGSGGGNIVWGYDTETGKREWKDTSKDSGISNIVIGLGRAYYTTYSCTLEGVDITTGKHLFCKYLAPTVSCAPDVYEDIAACAYHKDGSWKVSLHNADSGSTKWIKGTGNSGVVTAPVLYEKAVYMTTLDGGMQRWDQAKGKKEWTADFGAVSAPVPTPWGLLVTTTWDGAPDVKAAEQAKPMTEEERKKWERGTTTKTEPLNGTVVAARDRRVALIKDPSEAPKGKAKTTVTGPRSSLDYQGVRPGVSARNVIFAYDGKITAVNPVHGKVVWSVRVADGKTDFMRPLCHEGLVFVAGSDGTITALEEETGALIWAYHFKGQTFHAEPVGDADRVMVTTGSGLLVCLPIGIDEMQIGRPQVKGDGGVEGNASAYARVQETFRKVRNVVREVEEPEDMPGEPAPDARDGETPEGGAPAPAPADDGARRDDDEVEEISKGQWERQEERRAERAKAQGRDYEKQPFRRR
ncbi:MAG: PQQ-binding-like beta-propeller repeat protein [Planctomycetes bacterium]|nr:PQQ-binding-like beta-propeller repeat protein [Planctomycetota bacterium]